MILSRKELFETQGTITISAKASEPAFHDISLIPDKVVIILNISKNDSAAKLVGEVLAGINEQCDRCLKNFKKEIQGTFELIVCDDRHSEQKSNNSSINVLTLGKDSIDISSIIRESIFLEKSMKEVCFQDCKGLCSGCGTDLNFSDCKCENNEFDERWEPLKNLKLSKVENNYGTAKKKTI
tara:strand:- start:23146 stop:23691 length:546 start_codon:yes stop_codon:yes gene_type:complete